jgi:uncharacterized protein (DUF4415 family)
MPQRRRGVRQGRSRSRGYCSSCVALGLVRRPPLGAQPRKLIAIRVDADVLDQFRKEARRRRVGYQTLINQVLAEHVRKSVA